MSPQLLSQRDRVKMHLRTERSITPIEALRLFGCFRLGGIIFRLRREGWIIDTHRQGENGHARYTLVQAGD